MKKTLLYLLLSILAVTALFGVTAIVADNRMAESSGLASKSSDKYEVVYFEPPYRTIYYLSEVRTTEYIDEDGNKQLDYSLPFDGTGMSITVKHKESGKVKNYNYECEYFDLDGESIKYEDPIRFSNDSNSKFRFTEGEHTTSVELTTEDGEVVLHDFTYTMVDDDRPDVETTPAQTPTEVKYQTPEKEDASENHLILNDVRGEWIHQINQENCKIEITKQNSNELEMTITISNEKGTQVAIAAVNVAIDEIYIIDGELCGEGDFVYKDTFHNAGTGKIKVSQDSLTLSLSQGYNSNRGWNILRAIGEYNRVDK